MHSRRKINPSLLCVGDSLIAGTGTAIASQFFPQVLGTLFEPQRGSVNYGVGGESSAAILVRVQKYSIGSPIKQIMVIWAGRNDAAFTTQQTLDNHAAMVARVYNDPTQGQRFVVMTLPPKTDGTENTGMAARTALDAKSDALLAAYPTKSVDIRTIPGIMSPASRSDDLHLLAPYQAASAQLVYAKISALGW